jgi:septum formation protein
MLHNLSNLSIILASKSPRRQELLKGLDIKFEIRTKEIEESYPKELKAIDVPEFLAKKKANAFQKELKTNEVLITCDTIVILESEILEKPKDDQEAKQMIRKLAGKSHLVVTGVCISTLDQEIVFKDTAKVTFTTLTEEEINYYVDKYKPFDKAGSYGVQEWIGYIGIERMEGSYYTVMGLPVQKLYSALKTL